MLRRLRRRANNSEVSFIEYAAFLASVDRARSDARKGRILYLQHSGERITDLRTLPEEELHEWYTLVRGQNERRAKAEKEQLEKAMRARRRQEGKK